MIGALHLPEDSAFFERELASFVPEKVFDAHCHLWPEGQLNDRRGGFPSLGGAREYRQMIDWLHPGRHVQALYVPLPTDRCGVNESNLWVAEQAALDPADRGLFMIHPDDDPEWVREEVQKLGLCGLKCYHAFASSAPTWELDIPAYLPEPFMRVADEEGWVVLLHIVKSRGLADPGNQHWISHYCRSCPNAKLILAHSGRGFQPAHNLEGLPQLRGLDNLYFDTSANCEPIAHESVIRIIGHKRLMYGSDFFVSHLRGRSVAAADSFLWLYEDTPVWAEKHKRIQPVLVGLENLRSLKWACWSANMSDSQVEDIFWNNAAALLGVKQ